MSITFHKLKTKENSFDGILRQITEQIKSGKINPGDALPAERVMAEQLEISRPVVREVLKSLELVGIIYSVHGGGNYITKDIASCMVKPLSLTYDIIGARDDEGADLRSCLEMKNATLAAHKCTSLHAAELNLILERMKIAKTWKEAQGYDHELHFKISEIADSRIINITLLAIDKKTADTMTKFYASLEGKKEMQKHLNELHQKLVNAIILHKGPEAALAMNEHMEFFQKALANS